MRVMIVEDQTMIRSLLESYFPPEQGHRIVASIPGAKQAVEAGYWHCYRYNPELRGEGKNPFTLDSKAPAGSFRDFLMGEVRYSSLYRKFPEIADQLFAKAQRDAEERTETYLRLAGK